MVIDRLIGILAILLREGQVTAGDLAARFEVSVRTIRRDIDRLCRAGIPLVTARGAGGGVSIMEGYGLDRTVLTSGDRGAILAGLRSLDSVSGTGYYRQLMEKLPAAPGDSPDDCVLIDLASWYGPVLGPRLELLKGACLDRRTVAFTYCPPAGRACGGWTPPGWCSAGPAGTCGAGAMTGRTSGCSSSTGCWTCPSPERPSSPVPYPRPSPRPIRSTPGLSRR